DRPHPARDRRGGDGGRAPPLPAVAAAARQPAGL
ncbi:MAG: hypothetical protein AVDCRST_MAG73-786, partial [uncultured Thermomicrobiales bacterium]